MAGLAVNPSREAGEGVKVGNREGIDLTTSLTWENLLSNVS